MGDDERGAADDGPGATPPRRPKRPQRRDSVNETRQARISDLDRATFDKQRARAARKRAKLDRENYQPGPPDEDDFVVADRSQVRRVTGTPQPLGEVLDAVMQHRHWNERMRSAHVFTNWAEVVGEDVARNCEPVRLVGGVLVVAATSPSWATQLRYLSARLQLAVNTALGEPMVERVEVTLRR